jgi:hypothetical protein
MTVKPIDEFTVMLTVKMAVLQPHSLVVHHSIYLNELKSYFQVGAVIVLCDFTENYSFIL